MKEKDEKRRMLEFEQLVKETHFTLSKVQTKAELMDRQDIQIEKRQNIL
jgi:hypothetical protein